MSTDDHPPWKEPGLDLEVPESPQTVAALGCALHGAAEGR